MGSGLERQAPKSIPKHLAVESLPRLKKELPMLSLGLRGTGVERLHRNACELMQPNMRWTCLWKAMIPGTPSLNIVVHLWTNWSQQFRMHERLKNGNVVQPFELGPLGSTHWLQGEGRAFMGICSEMQLWQITLTHKLAQRMHPNKCRHFRKHAGHLLACAWIPYKLNFLEVRKHHCRI